MRRGVVRRAGPAWRSRHRAAAVAAWAWLAVAAVPGCGGADVAPEVRDSAEAPGLQDAGPEPRDPAEALVPAEDPAAPDAGGHDPAGQDLAGPEAPAEPPALRTVRSEPVHGRTGPGGQPFEVALRSPDPSAHLHRRIGAATFDLGLRVRQPDLTQYPCTSCHVPGERVVGSAGRAAGGHAHLEVVHPAETGAACATCHRPDRVDRLALATGDTATLDHAYRLCAQCHFTQVDAWAGGAHGKRLDGWRGRRVVMGCADCHDPHRPGLEARIPFPGPTIRRTGGRER